MVCGGLIYRFGSRSTTCRDAVLPGRRPTDLLPVLNQNPLDDAAPDARCRDGRPPGAARRACSRQRRPSCLILPFGARAREHSTRLHENITVPELLSTGASAFQARKFFDFPR